jgi:protein-tyrosine phosphatase
VLTDAELQRHGRNLVLCWSGDANVEITVGPSPDDAGPIVVDASSPHRVEFADPDPTVRHYARIQATDGTAIVVAERLLPLEGTVNFRDLGGYPTADGRHVRWGRVYRSDALSELSDDDLALLARIGLGHVCDLRRDAEAALAPDRLPDRVSVELLPIGGVAAETVGMPERIMAGEITDVDIDMMAGVYTTILRYHPDSFGAVARRAAAAKATPMVVHCTAGKDRTGMASALLLSLVGVSDDHVAEDYELSHRYYSHRKIADVRPHIEAAGVEFARVEAFFGAPRAVMHKTLEELRDTYGSAEGYLLGPAGVDRSTIEAIRAALLD